MSNDTEQLLNHLANVLYSDKLLHIQPRSLKEAMNDRLVAIMDKDPEVAAIARLGRELNRAPGSSKSTNVSESLLNVLSAAQSANDLGGALRELVQRGDIDLKAVGILCGGLAADDGVDSETDGSRTSHWSGVRYDHSTGNLLIETPQHLIPHGLLRVWLVDTSTDRVFTWLPKLALCEGYWYGKTSLNSVLGDYQPRAQIEIHAIQSASKENRELFDIDQVRAFMAGLESTSSQLELANTFLKGLSS